MEALLQICSNSEDIFYLLSSEKGNQHWLSHWVCEFYDNIYSDAEEFMMDIRLHFSQLATGEQKIL